MESLHEDFCFKQLESYVTAHLGDTLSLEKQIEMIRAQCWTKFISSIINSSDPQTERFARNAKVSEDVKFSPEYTKAWSDYIQLCNKKTDLYEIMQEYGVATFDFDSIHELANFFESEGDPYLIEFEQPVIDLRRADSIYRTAKANFKKLLKVLT